MPRISVTTPTRNRAHLIGRAIRSLGRQTYRDFELLVGDDGCKDDTLAVAEREAKRAGIALRIVNGGGPQIGLPAMRNRLVRESDSEFVAVLDDDDEFLPHRLMAGIRVMESDPGMSVVGGAVFRREEKSGRASLHRKPGTDLEIRRLALSTGGFFHSSVMARRAHLPGQEPYDETLERSHDSFLWAQMTRQEDRRFMNTVRATAVQHIHGQQIGEEEVQRAEARLQERLTALNLEFLARHGAPEDPVVAEWLATPRKWNVDPSSFPDAGRICRAYRSLDRRGRAIAGPSLALAVEARTRWYVFPELRGPASFACRILRMRGFRIFGGLAGHRSRRPPPHGPAPRPVTTAMVVYTLHRGGMERVTLDTARGLQARGHEVEILDLSSCSPSEELVPPANVNVWRAHPNWIRKLLGRILRLLEGGVHAPGDALRGKGDEQKAGTVERPSRWFSKGVLRRIAGRVRGLTSSTKRAVDPVAKRRFRRRMAQLAPHVIFVHEDLLAVKIARILGSMRESPPVVGVIHKVIPRRLDAAVRALEKAVASGKPIPFKWGVVNLKFGRTIAEWLGLDEREIIDLTNGIDMERITRMARSAQPMADAETILWVNRIVPIKRAEDAVQAFAVARRRRPMKLLVFGEGPEWSRLRTFADATGFGADISMPGFSENPYADMAACGAFALTSEVEGLPTTLIEALALGTFCVSTDCPHGPGEILNDPRLGHLVPVGNIEKLAEAMLMALDQRQAESQGKREFRMRNARERFGMEMALDRYDRLAVTARGGAGFS